MRQMISSVELDDSRSNSAARVLRERLSEGALNRSHQQKDDSTLMGSLTDFRKLMALVAAFYWLIMLAIIVPTACISSLLIFLYPLMLFSVSWFNRVEHELCRMANDQWVSAGQYAGVNVIESGDDISEIADKRVLCLVNHLGLVDHFCLMTAFHNKKSLTGKYLWVIYNIWKYTSLGAMWLSHGNFFINGGSAQRNRILEEFKEHLRSRFWKNDFGWVVMYPEGSRLFMIREAEAKFCSKNNITPYRFGHCAHPRIGAAHAVLEVCGPSPKRMEPVEYIVDVTLGYPKGVVPDIGDLMIGEWPEDSNIGIHYKVHKVQREWVEDEEKFKEWIYEQYRLKDELLETFYKTNRFPGQKSTDQPVQFPLIRIFMVQFFWIALFYFHYNVLIAPLFKWLLRSTLGGFL